MYRGALLALLLIIATPISSLTVTNSFFLPGGISTLVVTSAAQGYAVVVNDMDSWAWLRPFNASTMKLASTSHNVSLAPPKIGFAAGSILNVDVLQQYQSSLIAIVSGEVEDTESNLFFLISFDLATMKVLNYKNLSAEVVPDPAFNGFAAAMVIDQSEGVAWISGVIEDQTEHYTAFILKTKLSSFATTLFRAWKYAANDQGLQFGPCAAMVSPSNLIFAVEGAILSVDTDTNTSFVSSMVPPKDFISQPIFALFNSTALVVVREDWSSCSITYVDPITLETLTPWTTLGPTICVNPTSLVVVQNTIFLAGNNPPSITQFDADFNPVTETGLPYHVDSTMVAVWEKYGYYGSAVIGGGVMQVDFFG